MRASGFVNLHFRFQSAPNTINDNLTQETKTIAIEVNYLLQIRQAFQKHQRRIWRIGVEYERK